MKVIISTVAWKGHYPRAAARMIERFHSHSPGYEIQAWVNTLPPGTRETIVDGYDYTGYVAKPWALEYARQCRADLAILVDASFFPIRPIQPLVEHVQRNGYYLCRNGFTVGEWASDACLEKLNTTREEAFGMEEVSSYCVGIDLTQGWHPATEMLAAWLDAAQLGAFPGPHTNIGCSGRNVGLASGHARVKGHRHDQTALSIIAHRLKMQNLSERPEFTAYQRGYGGAFPNESTVLVNHGVIDGWTEGKTLATEQEQAAVIRALAGTECPVIVDLGAHQGEEYQWLYPHLGPQHRYIAVEADPRNFLNLNVNVPAECSVIHAAIAAHDGVTTLHLCDNTAKQAKGSSSIHQPTGHLKYFKWCTFEKKVEVKAMRLDTLMSEGPLAALPAIDLLWVDIQGAEKDAIAGGTETLKRTRFIMIEAEEVEMYEGQALKPELLALLPDFEVVEDFGYNVMLRRKDALSK